MTCHTKGSFVPAVGKSHIPIIAFGILLVVLLLSSPASAHPPSAMSFSYNPAVQELTVTITHGVRDANTHYIKEMGIVKNGVPFLTQTYTSQPSPAVFAYTYFLPGTAGDRIEVTATCNLYGSLTDTYILYSGPATAGSSGRLPVLWPFHMGLLSIGVVCMAVGVFFARSRNNRKGWYRAHSSLEKIGIVLIAAGITVGVYMVALSGGPHLRVTHGMIGTAGVILAGMGFSLGIGRKYIQKRKLLARAIHTRSGYITLGIMLVAAVTGILLLGLI
jgi:hypothetical protein